MKRFWKWLTGNHADHHWKHIPWSKTPPVPKYVEPGQGVRGETLGPRETIIPPKGGSGCSSGYGSHDDIMGALERLKKIKSINRGKRKEFEKAQAPDTILGQPIQVMKWEPGMIMIISLPRLDHESTDKVIEALSPLMRKHGIAREDIIVTSEHIKIDLVKREDIK